VEETGGKEEDNPVCCWMSLVKKCYDRFYLFERLYVTFFILVVNVVLQMFLNLPRFYFCSGNNGSSLTLSLRETCGTSRSSQILTHIKNIEVRKQRP